MNTITVAKYLRLSSEDEDLRQSGKLESNSIGNQRNLLDIHIRRIPELANAKVLEFCDDGWSGKNFERPAVRELLSQVKQGKIQCIIVKDLSRFGRDYLTVGNYISRVFPFLGVRFIAVNDGFDSIRPTDIDSLDTSFKALLYDLYSRDLSRKVRTAKRFRAQRGDFLSSFAPYGYQKDSANKNHLVVDPEAASVVRRIFQMAADGTNIVQIAKTLNHESVLTPMQYKRAAGCSRTVWPSVNEDNFWTDSTISAILRDERYTGKIIYGKKTHERVGDPHTVSVNRAEWITVEGTHEEIVTVELFNQVQNHMRTYTVKKCRRGKSLLERKVKCGICGHAMRRTKAKAACYICNTPLVTELYACSSEQTPEADILDTLLAGLRARAVIAVEFSRLWEEKCRGAERDAAATRKAMIALKEQHEKLGQQIKTLYESFAMDEISRTDYLALKNGAVREREGIAAQISELTAQLENSGAESALTNRFVTAFQKYTEVETITGEIVADVLEEIRIYPDKRIDIAWKYQDEFENLLAALEMEATNGTE